MKGSILFTIAFLAFLFLELKAQNVPQGINYQSIIRGSSGEPLISQNVSMVFSIRDNSGIVYQERQVNTTNSFGLVNLIIGQGVVQQGSFQNIQWNDSAKLLTISVETAPGSGWKPMAEVAQVTAPYYYPGQ